LLLVTVFLIVYIDNCLIILIKIVAQVSDDELLYVLLLNLVIYRYQPLIRQAFYKTIATLVA